MHKQEAVFIESVNNLQICNIESKLAASGIQDIIASLLFLIHSKCSPVFSSLNKRAWVDRVSGGNCPYITAHLYGVSCSTCLNIITTVNDMKLERDMESDKEL